MSTPPTKSPLRLWLYSLGGLAGFLIVSYVLIVYGLPWVLPFALALIIAQLIEPMVNSLTFKGKVPRGISVTVVLLIFVGIIGFLITVAVARLSHEIEVLIERAPQLITIGEELAVRYAEQFGTFHQSLPGSIQDMLDDALVRAEAMLPNTLRHLQGALTIFTSLPMILLNVLIALIATFFMSRDRRQINDFLLELFPTEWQPQIRQVRDKVWTSSMGFAKAQLILIAMTTIQTVIGLFLIGSNYAVTLGIMVGIADILPLLGPGTILLPWAAYLLIFGDTLFGIKVLILYAVIVGVRQVLEARVIGQQMGLHPLTILLALWLGFQAFGALGFLLGPVLAILLKAMIQYGLLPIFQKDSPIIK